MGELLADYTTLRLGGLAGQMLTYADPGAWPDLTQAVRREPVRPFTLGGGSNVLAADSGCPGPVICMTTRGITVRTLPGDRAEVTVQAGEPLSALVTRTVAEGLSGIEYLGGIPGTAGAAPVQNTGAYGQQISGTLTRVTAYDWQHGQTVQLPPATCAFGYRTSIFKTHPGRWTILAITLRLHRSTRAAPVTYQHLADTLGVPLSARPPLTEAARAVLTDRRARGLTMPDSGPDTRQAGSVFLNPPVTRAQADAIRAAGGPVHRDQDGMLRASAGWLLQQTGHHPGSRLAPGVYCSTRRTLTLVARDGATATHFTTALRTLAARVFEATAIRLHPEPVTLSRPVDHEASRFSHS